MNTPFHLTGKHILVTGASSGIGKCIAQQVATMGAKVSVSARNEERLQQTRNEMQGDGHTIISADLNNEAQLNSLVDRLENVDGVVFCSGLVKPTPIKFMTREKYLETLDTNYYAQLMLVSALMKKKKFNMNASLVFISSMGAHYPYIGGSLYASSKMAMEAMGKVVALENTHIKMRVNFLCPAMVKTPVFDETEKEISKEKMDEHIKRYPLGVGEPQDVANAAVFLLSGASRWITGQSIMLDGGFMSSY